MKNPTPLQIFGQLLFEQAKAKYPMIDPEHLEHHGKVKVNSANSLTQAVLGFLRLKGHQAERINTQGRRIDKTQVITDVLGYKRQIGSVQWVKGTGSVGSADISSIIKTNHGIVIPWKIEIKWGKDRISQAQVAYSEQVKKAGGHYSVVRDFDDFWDQYHQLINDQP